MKTLSILYRFFSTTVGSSLQKEGSKNGSSLMMVMLLVMVSGIMLGSLYVGSSQRTFTLNRETGRLKALTIAEAGLGDAFSFLAEDISRVSLDPVVSNDDFSNGSYVVRASVPEGANDGVVLLTATGTYRGQTVQSMATVLLESGTVVETGETPVLPLGPFGSAGLLAGADIVFSGGVRVNLKGEGAHANGNIDMSGGPSFYAGYMSTKGSIKISGNPTVNLSGTPQITLDGGANRFHADGPISILVGNIETGNISSSTSIETSWSSIEENLIAPNLIFPSWKVPQNKSTQAVENVPSLVLPFLDVEAFKSYAESNGTYFVGSQSIGRSWLTADILRRTGVNVTNNETHYAPDGGVLFVDGDVTVTSDMDFEGVIVATGNITFNGAATFTNPTDFPAMVSVDGNISVGAGASGGVDGWVYAMNGSVYCSGGAGGLSGIIAAQDIRITGGYSFGDDTVLNEITWPGAPSGGGGESESSEGGSLRLLSWIR
ncbi:hypothetical protein P3T73_04410 [Kiritimatiellota bacterium B12222]|nr:hypothetical protein P3T73_04410 [Kiritimatiellota bacterium B12222]